MIKEPPPPQKKKKVVLSTFWASRLESPGTAVAMVSFTQLALRYLILLYLERFLPSWMQGSRAVPREPNTYGCNSESPVPLI